jgi:glycosyltransferase involved in cell wall biosynthesis
MWSDAGKRDIPYDVVHTTAFPYAWPIVCGLRLARRLHVPFLLTPFLHLGNPDDAHDSTRKAYTRPALLALIRAADRVFVQTEWERTLLLEHGMPDPKRLVLLGMGVQSQECTGGNRDLIRRQWGIAGQDVVIGHLANKSEEKGTVDLLRAAERLWARNPKNCRLVLAGPEMPNFGRFWSSYPAADRVLRLGVLDEQQKRDFFAGLDVFALPSRSDSFGLVLLEAWANGLPNVAYRAGGIAEVIRHDEDGLLARCGDVDELAEMLALLLRDPALRHRLGQAGRERTRQEFGWQERLALVREVYEEVVRSQ